MPPPPRTHYGCTKAIHCILLGVAGLDYQQLEDASHEGMSLSQFGLIWPCAACEKIPRTATSAGTHSGDATMVKGSAG